ncbi:2-hydroxyacid dehydrogenase [Zongyangia hominis]|uniref:Hydroxyacid dehydrogenase n=1 Tax=Zongyangia hominis TaxID=2763677 RepID=A0A926EAX9_9FIRM|nr:2-hydroxyacid dehydrogenase [Zongyangia hominis]MBC8571175.1 hydroxyacid dehydrogenase [Zongyangia hominis]
MKIVLLEPLGVSQQVLDACAQPLLDAGHTFTAYPKDTDPAVQIERAKDADIIMVANMPLSGEVIRACESLKFIDIAFTGVDHVDLAAAKEKGVAVSNAAGYSTQAVAELTLCMMLSLLRHVPQVEERCRAGMTKEGLVGCELAGKTVGIIGTGAIGLRTAQLCKAFGCKVIGYAPRPKEAAEGILTYVSLEELLTQSDIVSLHCPINDSSRHMISRERLALMKPSALLINVARGPVVDSQALADALNAGIIAGAGIDVFENESPLPVDHPLLHSKNTLVTPHVAFASQESMAARAKIVFENITRWLDGHQQNIVL